MFSFSEYVRRLARDATLAGIYDAIELVEGPGGHDAAQAADLFAARFGGPPGPHPLPPAADPRPAAAPPPPPRPPLPLPTFPPAGESPDARRRGRPPKSPGGGR